MNSSMKKLKVMHSLILLNFFFTYCLSQNNTSNNLCGKIPIEPPFLTSNSSLLLCRSQKVYLRTTRGLFPVSSVNYTTQTLTLFHPIYSTKDQLKENNINGYEKGIRVDLDIPDHVPDICKDCHKPNRNCSAGLQCICHLSDCKDKVIGRAGSLKEYGNSVLFSLLVAVVLLLSNSRDLI